MEGGRKGRTKGRKEDRQKARQREGGKTTTISCSVMFGSGASPHQSPATSPCPQIQRPPHHAAPFESKKLTFIIYWIFDEEMCCNVQYSQL